MTRTAHQAGFHQQNLAAALIVGQACADAHLGLVLALLVTVFLDAQKTRQALTRNGNALFQIILFHQADGRLAAQSRDFPLQIAHPGLARVGADDLKQGILRDADIILLQAVFLYLARQKEMPGDMSFFRFQVTVELDDLHAIQQRHRDSVQGIGCGDKKNLGKIIFQVQIMIHKGMVLLGIQHFQQGRGRIAPVVRGHLVHFVQAEQGIVELDPLQRLDNLARQRAHIGAAVSPDLGLVAHAAQGEAHEIPPRGLGHGLGQGGFAHAGRSHETKYGAFQAV